MGHVFNYPIATFHAKVDIEVRHGDTFRVQEALEQQVILQRINIRNLDGIRHQRTRT